VLIKYLPPVCFSRTEATSGENVSYSAKSSTYLTLNEMILGSSRATVAGAV
jgi:hypothetical protein